MFFICKPTPLDVGKTQEVFDIPNSLNHKIWFLGLRNHKLIDYILISV